MEQVFIYPGSGKVGLTSIVADFKKGELLVEVDGNPKTYAKKSGFLHGLTKYLDSKGLNTLGDEEGEELHWSSPPLRGNALVFDASQPFLKSWYAKVRKYDMLNAAVTPPLKISPLMEKFWANQRSKGLPPSTLYVAFHEKGSTQPAGYVMAWSVSKAGITKQMKDYVAAYPKSKITIQPLRPPKQAQAVQLNAKARLLADASDVKRWAKMNSKEQRAPFRKLIETLTTGASESAVVVPREDPQIDAIIKRGKFFPTKGSMRFKGFANQCHANTAALFNASKIDAIVTGYALADDGGWRSHTWGLIGKTLIETTPAKYGKYFGVQLNAKEAKAFAADNPLP